MVQRKVPSKLGIQADHVKSDKHMESLKLFSSSQHQDGKSRGADMKKKIKKSKPIKLSDLKALQSSSSPSRKSLYSQPGKPPPPLQVRVTVASPQKVQPLVRTTNGSPNYMKPTSSSDAKKELFPVSLRNTQSSGSDIRNLTRKFSSDSKASCVSSKKKEKTLARSSSSLKLVRTLRKAPSFKPSRACPKKSTRAALYVDINAPHRPTCSSTLKDSKFPAYLMLNPGGTESEGTSLMKVCRYTYCSLNGHRHASLPPLKSFMSSRRRLLKTQKSMKLEKARSPPRLKVPCEIKKEDSEIELDAFDGKHEYDELDKGNPNISPLVQEIGIDFFIEIYAKEKEEKPTVVDEAGKINFLKELEDQEDIKSTTEKNGIAAGKDGVKLVSPFVPDTHPKSEIDFEEDFNKYFDDVAMDVETKGSLQEAEGADENYPPGRCHEEISMGSYCSEASYDGEKHLENVEMDDSDIKASDVEWEEEKFDIFDHEEDNSSSVFTEEETDSKIETLPESSHDVSVTWLDDILSGYLADILAEETRQEEANEVETIWFEEQIHGTSSVMGGTSESTKTQEPDYPSNDMGCDQSSFSGEVFEDLTNAEHNGEENATKQVNDEASCAMEILDLETVNNSQCHKMSETSKIDKTRDDGQSSLENRDEKKEHLCNVHDESSISVQDHGMLEKNQGKAEKFKSTSCIGGDEEKNTSKNWKGAIKRKRPIEDDDEMRKFNPREPNFLPLVPEPESEKVDLRHQMMDERKNAEEWMIDCALRQVVTKLAPARKKKVALLVEAFETVMPIPKCETHMRNNSTFGHARRIQACS